MLEKYCTFKGESSGLQACLDEAGRGSWAGRVYVAAVIWNNELDDDYTRMIRDSKKLSPAVRSTLYDYITANAIDYSITYTEPQDIDKMNILNATLSNMHDALSSLSVSFDTIIVDGNQFIPYYNIPYKCIVGGDNKYIGIACASILAKVEHDRHMVLIDKEFPCYDWKSNMGYGVTAHREALRTHGVCKHHRRSYNPMKEILCMKRDHGEESTAAS